VQNQGLDDVDLAVFCEERFGLLGLEAAFY